jgi:hypothetical protein
VTARVSDPERECALVDRLFVLHARQHGLVSKSAPEIVFLDRQAVDAADAHAGFAARFADGVAVVQFLKRREVFFDAANDYG